MVLFLRKVAFKVPLSLQQVIHAADNMADGDQVRRRLFFLAENDQGLRIRIKSDIADIRLHASHVFSRNDGWRQSWQDNPVSLALKRYDQGLAFREFQSRRCVV